MIFLLPLWEGMMMLVLLGAICLDENIYHLEEKRIEEHLIFYL